MRSVPVVVAFVGFALTACGAAEPTGEQPPAPSPSTGSSVAPAPTTDVVPGTGEPYDPAARVQPELMTVTPASPGPGEPIELTFPEQTERGVAYVLERAVGESWSTTHFMTSSADGYGGTPSAVAVDAAEGYGWEDIGIGGPGPDRLVLPGDATIGASRICTANALENFCAAIDVIESATVSTSPVTTTPVTSTPDTTVAPKPTVAQVPIVAVHEDVAFYPACGNETLTFDGLTWYQLNHSGGDDEEYTAIYRAFADAEREPSPVAAGQKFAPAVVEPGPGDDVGTLVIWADGVARWVSASNDLDVWMVDDEITYDWVC